MARGSASTRERGLATESMTKKRDAVKPHEGPAGTARPGAMSDQASAIGDDPGPLPGEADPPIVVRPARPADLPEVIAIDTIVTGLEKSEYWSAIERRYGNAERAGRGFLVAEVEGEVAGFVLGEVRDWEFGSPPCGWVFAIDVHPRFRLAGVGTQLVAGMADWFRREGVTTMRTILARDNTLILSFFRSLGMTTGPFIPLEIDLARMETVLHDRESVA